MSNIWIKPMSRTGEHSYHRRAIKHDYYAPFIYHIVIKKAPGCASYGSIVGDARIAPGNPGCAMVKESELGTIIAKAVIHLPFEHRIIKLFQFCVMPDHIHILIQVRYRSPYHLDYYIDYLRNRIVARYSKLLARPVEDEEVFAPGYCDKPLYDGRNLNSLFLYIEQNPHRLAMRQQYPSFFQRVRNLKIGQAEYAAYGNLFLFRNPDKSAVKISHRFTDQEKHEKKTAWLTGAAKGTVLVSPFISMEEKAIRTEAEALGSGIILITHQAFSERYKPPAHDFELCARGQLLIITIGLPPKTELSRATCSAMNKLAQLIASF